MKTTIKFFCLVAAALVLITSGSVMQAGAGASAIQLVQAARDAFEPYSAAADNATIKLGKDLKRLEKGELAVADVMPALDHVIETCAQAETAAKELAIPDALPADVARMCRLYAEQAGWVYSKRRQAMESLAAYLSERKPDQLKRYQKLMAESMQHTTNMKHSLSKAMKKAKAARS
jgi:hypothetical protein